MTLLDETRAGFSAGFVVDFELPAGERFLFGEPAGQRLQVRVPHGSPAIDPAHFPFVDAPALHGDARFRTSGVDEHRMFPLEVATLSFPGKLAPELAMLWIVHDGPFGKFAWKNVFVAGQCLWNATVPVAEIDGMSWDVVAEVDFEDCVGCFLGDLEMRDLIKRGHVSGPLSGLSALSWFVEREEMTARAAPLREEAEMLVAWAQFARRD